MLLRRISVLAAVSAVAAGFSLSAAEWDFTKGVPADCTLRAYAEAVDRGLVPKQLCDRDASPAGAVVSGFAFPCEAFVFEAEIVPYLQWKGHKDRVAALKPTKDRIARRHVLWDSSAGNRGFRIYCEEWFKRWTPYMEMCVGGRMITVSGPVIEPRSGEPLMLTVSFDAMGNVGWDFSGHLADSRIDAIGGIDYGKEILTVIGDSAMPEYSPPNAAIRRVALHPRTRARFSVQSAGRIAFARGEKGASVVLRGVAARPVSDATVSIRQHDGEGRVFSRSSVKLGSLKPESFRLFRAPVETRLKCGRYFVDSVASVDWADEGRSVITQRIEMVIGPVFADRMPAVMWGVDGYDEAVASYGFTHEMDRYSAIRSLDCSDSDDESRLTRLLDRAMTAGMKLMKAQPLLYPEGKARSKYYRIGRDGSVPTRKTPLPTPQPEVSHPDMVDYARRFAEKENSIMSGHPAFAGILPCSEWRDGNFPSFNTEHLRYRKDTGRDVPPEIENNKFDLETARKRYPDGVVPDDDPILAYYRWFWRGGDGWPGYVGAIADVYSRNRGEDFFTYWDPAVRCPPGWGSGGSVQAISQWVYAQPEPMYVAGPAEEIIAMAEGRPGQLPMIMTQLICYRAQLAPKNVKVAPLPEWMKRIPNATFPTIPADALQQALWSMIAKPVKGVMFYGWGNIYDTGSNRYAYTSPATAEMMRRLLKDVVAPLGPVLKYLGRKTPQVAVLESFTSAILGGPGAWGWRSPAITFFQRAGLDPRVVYEDTIARDGLAGVKMLYAPDCLFLSASTVEAVRRFQRGGGILIADEKLLPVLKADVEVPVMAYIRPPKADVDEEIEKMTGVRINTVARSHTQEQKRRMVEAADGLRRMLAAKYGYRPSADRSSAEIAVYSRAWKDTPYLFAVNDNRTFGDYVGQWGLTMDKGLPYEGSVSLEDGEKRFGAVYELSRGGELQFEREGDRINVPLKFDTNDGRMLVFLPCRIAGIDVEAPESVRAGEPLCVKMIVKDTSGNPVQALLPVEIRIRDASGRELDGAGFACARDGVCELSVGTNLNDPPGSYSVTFRDRSSGATVRRSVRRSCDPDGERISNER